MSYKNKPSYFRRIFPNNKEENSVNTSFSSSKGQHLQNHVPRVQILLPLPFKPDNIVIIINGAIMLSGIVK